MIDHGPKRDWVNDVYIRHVYSDICIKHYMPPYFSMGLSCPPRSFQSPKSLTCLLPLGSFRYCLRILYVPKHQSS